MADSSVDKLMWYFFFFLSLSFSLSQKIGFNWGDSLHEMFKLRILFSGKNNETISKCCLLKCLPSMLNVNTKKSLMRVLSSYCIRIAKVKLNLCIHTVSSGSSLDCSCLLMYYIVSVNFKRTKVLIRLIDDKVLRYRRYILLFISKKKIKERRNTMFTLNILTPYHTYPKKFNKVIYLPVYLSKIARWATFSNDSNHSAFCSGPHCLLRLRVKTVSAN